MLVENGHGIEMGKETYTTYILFVDGILKLDFLCFSSNMHFSFLILILLKYVCGKYKF